SVEAFCHGLTRSASKRLRPSINLDAGKNALACEDVRKRHSTGTLLVKGLVLQDGPADELADTCRREEHFPVGAPTLFGGPDPESVKALGQSRDGLVGREDAFPLSDQCRRDALQVLRHVALPFPGTFSRRAIELATFALAGPCLERPA